MRIPETPPDFLNLTQELSDNDRLLDVLTSGCGNYPPGKYLHWDETRFREPPPDINRKEWWWAIKNRRIGMMSPLPLASKNGSAFQYSAPDNVIEMLHRIDCDTSGQIGSSALVTNADTRNRFLIKSLMEEAITSSQLEGASTTRAVAKEMLRRGRKPRDHSEHMIVNNFRAMELIRESSKDALSVELILELHRVLTRNTLPANEIGRWRNADKDIRVYDPRDGKLLHIPPDAEELSDRLKALVAFANASNSAQDGFMSPAVRSIIVHFMFGYDHPFVDGNGRTARALFYWCMAHNGYWLIEFLSISSVLLMAPAQYARAYLYSETDDNDLTYFIIYNLKVILRALNSAQIYLTNKAIEVEEAENLLKSSERLRSILNHRQVALLNHALNHQSEVYTIQSHRRSHGVTYQTARTDLKRLANAGLLTQTKKGKAFLYFVPDDLREKMESYRDTIALNA